MLYLSSYILMVMAIDRFYSLCQSIWHLKSIKFVNKLILVAYIVSAVFSFPQLIIFKLSEINAGVKDCWVNFQSKEQEQAYVASFVAIAFVIPFIVMTFCYLKIIINLRDYYKNQKGGVMASASKNKYIYNTGPTVVTHCAKTAETTTLRGRIIRPFPMERRLTRANLRNAKMTAVVIVCFAACWLPYSVSILYLTFGPTNGGMMSDIH